MCGWETTSPCEGRSKNILDRENLTINSNYHVLGFLSSSSFRGQLLPLPRWHGAGVSTDLTLPDLALTRFLCVGQQQSPSQRGRGQQRQQKQKGKVSGAAILAAPLSAHHHQGDSREHLGQ